MADVPYPLTAADESDLRRQIYELIRQLFEEKIGGANLGDTFAIVGDVLTLTLAIPSGLTKSGNELAIEVLSTGGLQIGTTGISIKIVSTGGLESSASGLGVKLDGNSLETSASGIKVGQEAHINDPAGGLTVDTEARTAINSILDLLEARGLMAA